MAFRALELRNVAQVERMLEGPVTFVAYGALPGILIAKIYGVLKHIARWNKRFARKTLVNRSVANRAFVSDDLPIIAEMLPVMTTETALGVVMSDVIDMCLPIRLHLREEVGLVYPLKLRDSAADRVGLA